MQEQQLMDSGDYPEIYAELVGDYHVIGGDLHIALARWRRVDGVYRPCVVCEIVRPLEVVRTELGLWQTMVKRVPKPPIDVLLQ